MSRYGGATACVAIDPDDDSAPIVLDLGTGARRLGERWLTNFFSSGARPGDLPIAAVFGLDDAPSAELPHPVPQPDPVLDLNVFATHLHFDHIQGLPFFGPVLRPDTRLSIYGPRQPGTSLSEVFADFIRPPYFPVPLGELPAELCFFEVGDGEVQLGSTRVKIREVPHVGLTVGYRIETDGVSIAYVSDHQAPAEDGAVRWTVSESVLELCDGADLLIHDAQYTDEEFSVKAHWGHSTWAYALHVAREAGVRRLALFHHDPTRDDAALDELARVAGDSFLASTLEAVIVAAEGSSVELASSDFRAVGYIAEAGDRPTEAGR